MSCDGLVDVIKRGPQIDAKQVDSGGTNGDPLDVLWLDGKGLQGRRSCGKVNRSQTRSACPRTSAR